jgi:polyhydroxyalkanoate synthase
MAKAHPRAQQSPPQPPRPRLGPIPLPLHLAIQTASLLASSAAFPLLRSGSLPWKPSLKPEADQLRQEALAANPDALSQAVNREGLQRLHDFITGVDSWLAHPYRRKTPETPVFWQEGTTRLLDFGPATGAKASVILIPSLVNRSYILDLTVEQSLARHLARQGVRTFLVDWDAPGEEERGFDLTDYIAGRLGAALDAVRQETKDKPVLAGYCMGGLLALALAQLHSRNVSGLALLATPWDFQAERAEQGLLMKALEPHFNFIIDQLGELPLDILQSLFASLDPDLVPRKFRAFARLDAASPKAREFVALEDWVNDGVPLAGPVARECLFGWYGDNVTAKGEWRVAGQRIRPEKLDLPTLVFVPEQDRIVPPGSALPLAHAIRNAAVKTVKAGHIGMVTGRSASEILYNPLGKWILEVSHTCAKRPRSANSR